MLYSDIVQPSAVGDSQTQLLRSVPLNYKNYSYGSLQVQNFSKPNYVPLLMNSFRTIDIDIGTQLGQAVPFDYGTLCVTLEFRRAEL